MVRLFAPTLSVYCDPPVSLYIVNLSHNWEQQTARKVNKSLPSKSQPPQQPPGPPYQRLRPNSRSFPPIFPRMKAEPNTRNHPNRQPHSLRKIPHKPRSGQQRSPQIASSRRHPVMIGGTSVRKSQTKFLKESGRLGGGFTAGVDAQYRSTSTDTTLCVSPTVPRQFVNYRELFLTR